MLLVPEWVHHVIKSPSAHCLAMSHQCEEYHVLICHIQDIPLRIEAQWPHSQALTTHFHAGQTRPLANQEPLSLPSSLRSSCLILWQRPTTHLPLFLSHKHRVLQSPGRGPTTTAPAPGAAAHERGACGWGD